MENKFSPGDWVVIVDAQESYKEYVGTTAVVNNSYPMSHYTEVALFDGKRFFVTDDCLMSSVEYYKDDKLAHEHATTSKHSNAICNHDWQRVELFMSVVEDCKKCGTKREEV